MENQNGHIPGGNETSSQISREIAFDATTNFSLLGWLWDKFGGANSSKKLIDLDLEE